MKQVRKMKGQVMKISEDIFLQLSVCNISHIKKKIFNIQGLHFPYV